MWPAVFKGQWDIYLFLMIYLVYVLGICFSQSYVKHAVAMGESYQVSDVIQKGEFNDDDGCARLMTDSIYCFSL